MYPATSKAQLFEDNELFPNVTLIKGKYYNGTGDKNYWSFDDAKTQGRDGYVTINGTNKSHL